MMGDDQAVLDVLIVGAGLSGVGAACHLTQRCPKHTFAVLESRESIGGTWDLFTYPGVRSDSDMYTLGYNFRPWRKDRSLASGAEICDYIRDTAREFGILPHIRFRHKALSASWSTIDAVWSVNVSVAPATKERAENENSLHVHSGFCDAEAASEQQIKCRFLWLCTGYFDYQTGHDPTFAGSEKYRGRIVHPQFWPSDLNYAGKTIVVIGSGATAITLVPALVEGGAAHVTMLQRSPTYVLSINSVDRTMVFLRRILPAGLVDIIGRWKNAFMAWGLFKLSRARPEPVRKLIMRGVKKACGSVIDVATHFNPKYDPWRERMCIIPDNNLFGVLKRGAATVVTDHILRFSETGIVLQSGREIEADLVITATGLKLLPAGGMVLDVDGERVHIGDTVTYKGTMLSGVPNFAAVMGYSNASWTLKADLVCEYICRLLRHMRRKNLGQCTPIRPADSNMNLVPTIDFSSGYVQRAAALLPKQGTQLPWRMHQSYFADIIALRYGSLETDVEFRPSRKNQE